MDRAGALRVGNYALPNSLTVSCLYHRLHNGVCGNGNTVFYFIGTVRPEPPEIHSGKLPASHMDLACQLGL
jgi:S-adenosylmethionine synthetase